MKRLRGHWEKLSGHYWFLTSLSLYLFLIALIAREGWIR